MKTRPRIVWTASGCRWLLLVCLAGLGTSGCGETEQISRYAVPKATAPTTEQPFDVSNRPALAWFFKLTGPESAVAAQSEAFQRLVASVSLSEEDATWTLPDGWTQQPASQMRYATLTIPAGDPPLEVSVSKLPLFAERTEYLLQNINRWRGQLGLPPLAGDDWLSQAITAGEIEQPEVAGLDVTRLNMMGQTAEAGSTRLLAAIILPATSTVPGTTPGADSSSAQPPRMSAQELAPAADAPLTYVAPPEWQPGKTSMLRVAAFDVTDGDQQAEITVIPAGGDLLSNVNRWRGQINLEPWTEQQLAESAEQLTIDGQPATYVTLVGSEKTILAAVLPQGEQSWFFKLTGAPELAAREVDRFKAFVESVTITSR